MQASDKDGICAFIFGLIGGAICGVIAVFLDNLINSLLEIPLGFIPAAILCIVIFDICDDDD